MLHPEKREKHIDKEICVIKRENGTYYYVYYVFFLLNYAFL